MTLVELLVSMLLLVIVIGLATGAIIEALDRNSGVTQQSEAQTRNNVGMEQMTRSLRQAVLPTHGTKTNSTIITVAQPTQIQFTTRLSATDTAEAANTWNTPVVQMKAQLNATSHALQWGTGAENSTACTDAATVCTYATPTVNKTLVYGVRNDQGTAVCPKNTGDGAVFHYWYVDPTGNLAAWSSPAHTLAEISVVQIDLWTQTQTGPNKPACVPLTDYVQLRNWK
jgi:hypothetical protein